MNAIIFALLAGLLAPAVWWLGGYDFDIRGEKAVWCFIVSVYLAVAVYFFVNQQDKK